MDEKVSADEELEQAGSQESETKTEIIVKPDGSRVLVMTMSIGGMETTMSLEISKPQALVCLMKDETFFSLIEYDMKHSGKAVPNQYCHLIDEDRFHNSHPTVKYI